MRTQVIHRCHEAANAPARHALAPNANMRHYECERHEESSRK